MTIAAIAFLAGDGTALFEISFAWDGITPGTSRRFVIGEKIARA
jgi:hypothetical protein